MIFRLLSDGWAVSGCGGCFEGYNSVGKYCDFRLKEFGKGKNGCQDCLFNTKTGFFPVCPIINREGHKEYSLTGGTFMLLGSEENDFC